MLDSCLPGFPHRIHRLKTISIDEAEKRSKNVTGSNPAVHSMLLLDLLDLQGTICMDGRVPRRYVCNSQPRPSISRFEIELCEVFALLLPLLTSLFYLSSPLTRKIVRRDERGPFLTGVGISRSPGDLLIAPRDENRRYDDYGFSDSDKDQFSSSPVSHANPGTGYVFHESCWRVLKACLYPSPVPVQTLYNICRSSPITCPGFVDLGLDYWGFIWGPKLQYSQRASRHVLRRVAPRIGRTSVMGSNAQFDPFDIPKLERILDKTQQPAPQEDTGPSISPSFRNQSDCFNRLPPELLEEIRVLLPSSDVANLHLISRTFASLSLSQYFWASRFRGTCERSHIFEPTILEFDIDGRKTRRDWKSLYHETGRVHSPPDTLYSRERVWNCIRPLAELLVEIPPVSDGAVREFQGVETETDGWKSAPGWRCIGGNFRPRSHRIPWSMACNIRFEQNVYVPEDLERIDVTILSFCDQQYVSGLRLISRKKSNIQLGYVISGKETILHVGDRDGGQNILTGFICALGDLGIQGLRTVASKGQLSEWAGAATDSSQTLRLCVGQPISELKAAFDVCEYLISFLPLFMDLIRLCLLFAKIRIPAGVQNGWSRSSRCIDTRC